VSSHSIAGFARGKEASRRVDRWIVVVIMGGRGFGRYSLLGWGAKDCEKVPDGAGDVAS